jgi:UDP-N-acetylglucosamine 2-epimerase (non-hydrolysing)
MAPVLAELDRQGTGFDSRIILTSQHTSLIRPLLSYFRITPDIDLEILKPGQSLDELLGRLLIALHGALDRLEPDVVMVQGDTTSALAGAMAAHHRQIPVVHVEAGLRSGHRYSPFPEEMNRRLVTQLSQVHMAATAMNRANLLAEGIADDLIAVTGNPVVDAVQHVLRHARPSSGTSALLEGLAGKRIITLTTHRRENFGGPLRGYMTALSDFVHSHPDTVLIFPVHPNPAVIAECRATLRDSDRIRLVEPMNYPDFIHVLDASWMIASDSGGIQEEAPSLGRPLIILRNETERPEVLDCGAARLAGGDPEKLMRILTESYTMGSWLGDGTKIVNPFGDGDAAKRIVARVGQMF